MTQEEKYLLLQDLSARSLYGVKVWHFGVTRELLWIIPSTEIVMVGYDINDYEDSVIEDIKPYLRPMSSMTEEEEEEFEELFIGYSISRDRNCVYHSTRGDLNLGIIDWLNSHHFDYNTLIEKGLALEAPENMYE